MDALKLAEAFHRTGEWDYSLGTTLLRSLLITPGMRVLELGSATGRLAIDAAHMVAPDGEVLAFEPSEERYAIARRFYRAGNVTFHRGGPEDLAGLEEASVDFAYSNLLLHRLGEPLRALEALYRVLKPGGSLAFTSPLTPPAVIEALEMAVFSHPSFSPRREGSSGLASWSLRSLEEWAALLKEAGFRGVSFHTMTSELAAESPEALVAYWEAATEGRFLGGFTRDDRLSTLAHVDRELSALWGGGKPFKSPADVAAIQTARPG